CHQVAPAALQQGQPYLPAEDRIMAPSPAQLLSHLRRLAESPAPDAALLDRFLRDRDEPAFAALVRRHGPMVFRVCRRVLADPPARGPAPAAAALPATPPSRPAPAGGARCAGGRRGRRGRRAPPPAARGGRAPPIPAVIGVRRSSPAWHRPTRAPTPWPMSA